MNSFNDYCIVCDQLITTNNNDNDYKNDNESLLSLTTNNNNSSNSKQKLYCSDYCREKDEYLYKFSNDLKYNAFNNSLLLSSSSSSSSSSNKNTEIIDNNNATSPTKSITKSCDATNTKINGIFLSESITNLQNYFNFEHIVENNYNLWLSLNDNKLLNNK